MARLSRLLAVAAIVGLTVGSVSAQTLSAVPARLPPVLQAQQARVAMNELAVPAGIARPDDRTGVRGPGATGVETPQLVSVANDSFSWKDAGIGAGIVLAASLLLASGFVLTRRRHGVVAV